MKLLLFTGIFYVFCSEAISSASENGQQVSKSHNLNCVKSVDSTQLCTIQHKNDQNLKIYFKNYDILQTEKVKMNLLNINDDCQLIIFEQLDMIDLISMAETNSNLFYFTQRILRQKFTKKEMVFRSPYVTEDVRNHVKEFNDRIEIQHWPTIEKILPLFGHLIRKLEVVHRYKLTTVQSTQIQSTHFFKLINSHCANTLEQMRIISKAYNDIFAELKTPFKKLEYLAISGDYMKFNKTNFAFNELFPVVTTLHISAEKIRDLGLCEQSLQHLNELSTEDQDNDHRNVIQTIIKNHPRLKSLILKYVDSNLLEFVADELKHLENLEIHHYNQDHEDDLSFEFRRLKRFSVFMTMPTNLIFHEIEEFEIVNFLRSPDLIKQVLQFKQHLKKLLLRTPLNNNDIVQLANAKLNLTELTISCGKDIGLDNVVELLNGSQHLMKLFIDNESEELRRLTIKSLLEAKFKYQFHWMVNEIHNQIVLERQ